MKILSGYYDLKTNEYTDLSRCIYSFSADSRELFVFGSVYTGTERNDGNKILSLYNEYAWPFLCMHDLVCNRVIGTGGWTVSIPRKGHAFYSVRSLVWSVEVSPVGSWAVGRFCLVLAWGLECWKDLRIPASDLVFRRPFWSLSCACRKRVGVGDLESFHSLLSLLPAIGCWWLGAGF